MDGECALEMIDRHGVLLLPQVQVTQSIPGIVESLVLQERASIPDGGSIEVFRRHVLVRRECERVRRSRVALYRASKELDAHLVVALEREDIAEYDPSLTRDRVERVTEERERGEIGGEREMPESGGIDVHAFQGGETNGIGEVDTVTGVIAPGAVLISASVPVPVSLNNLVVHFDTRAILLQIEVGTTETRQDEMSVRVMGRKEGEGRDGARKRGKKQIQRQESKREGNGMRQCFVESNLLVAITISLSFHVRFTFIHML